MKVKYWTNKKKKKKNQLTSSSKLIGLKRQMQNQDAKHNSIQSPYSIVHMMWVRVKKFIKKWSIRNDLGVSLYIKAAMPLQWFNTVHSVLNHCLFTVHIQWNFRLAFVFFFFLSSFLFFFFFLPFIYTDILIQKISQYFHNYWGVNFL